PLATALPARDVQYLISQASHLDTVIATAARNANASIDVLEQRYAFAGHETCARTPYVNGVLGAGTAPESFHPNRAGYSTMARQLTAAIADRTLLVRAYRDLRDPRPGTPNAPTARALLGLLPPVTLPPPAYHRDAFQSP